MPYEDGPRSGIIEAQRQGSADYEAAAIHQCRIQLNKTEDQTDRILIDCYASGLMGKCRRLVRKLDGNRGNIVVIKNTRRHNERRA